MTLRKTEEIFGLILVVNLKPDEKKEKDDFSVSDTGGSEEKIRLPPTWVKPISAGPDLEISGGGGGEGGSSKKKIGPQFALKIRGGGAGPPDPSPGFATAYDLLVTSPDTLALNSSTELQENRRSCFQVSAFTPPNLK